MGTSSTKNSYSLCISASTFDFGRICASTTRFLFLPVIGSTTGSHFLDSSAAFRASLVTLFFYLASISFSSWIFHRLKFWKLTDRAHPLLLFYPYSGTTALSQLALKEPLPIAWSLFSPDVIDLFFDFHRTATTQRQRIKNHYTPSKTRASSPGFSGPFLTLASTRSLPRLRWTQAARREKSCGRFSSNLFPLPGNSFFPRGPNLNKNHIPTPPHDSAISAPLLNLPPLTAATTTRDSST